MIGSSSGLIRDHIRDVIGRKEANSNWASAVSTGETVKFYRPFTYGMAFFMFVKGSFLVSIANREKYPLVHNVLNHGNRVIR